MARILQFQLIFFCFILISLSDAQAKVIIAKPQDSNHTLAQAFERAEHGDTVLIKSGRYQEGELFLKKSITLLGEDYPIIDGENKHEILFVESDSVQIIGISFENSGTSNFTDIAALKINNSKHVLIQDCVFKDNFFGIHTMSSQYVKYINNKLIATKSNRKSANGIHIWKTTHVEILNNHIEGHRDGIYLEFVEKSMIQDNISIGNSRYGMHFMFSHDNVFKHNVFKENGAGVAVMYSKRVEMYENDFSKSWGNAAYGLLLKEIDDSRIEDNTFQNNTIGIYGDGANRVEVIANNFINNGWAMKMNASSSDAVITNNNFLSNTFDFATNGNLKVKSMNENYWDKYEGYDLDRDGFGDIPYRPITFFSLIIERNQGTLMLFRSFFVKLMDKAEGVFPSLTPENIKDDKPRMRKI